MRYVGAWMTAALLLAPVARADEALENYALTARAFRAAAARVEPSLVRIETYGGLSVPTGPVPREARPDRSRRAPRRLRGIGKPGEGPTTGVILSADGLIVTSTFNFLREPPIITVVLADGSRHVAELLGRDETRGLCLLKIHDAPPLPEPAWVGADEVRIGQWTVALGYGFGSETPALSAGIVSAVGRASGRALQTDANLSPANYGGPLVDVEGRVLGVCVALSPRGGPAAAGVQWYDSGIGFAIPREEIEVVRARMEAGEVIRPGRLGIRVAGARAEGGGVGVEEVRPESAAATAGLEKGDVIVALDGATVDDMQALRRLLGRCIAGDEVTLTLKRGEETRTVTLTLEGGGEADLPPPPDPFPLPGDGRGGEAD